MTKKGLIIFLRNPVLGQVKTRLAKDLGEKKTLEVYKKLIEHTFSISKGQDFKIIPYFYPEIPSIHIFQNFQLHLQSGNDLGESMYNAFKEMFDEGYNHIALIGSDCFQLKSSHLISAFKALDDKEYVIGPAKDGGYYLIGMTSINPELFKDIDWSTENVFRQSIERIKDNSVYILEELNDIDDINDLIQEKDLKHFAH